MDKASHAAQAATITTYSASAGSITFGAFTVNEIGVMFGMVLGALTFLVNVYFRLRMVRIAEDKHDETH